MSLQRFEISFLLHGDLSQFQFMGTRELADETRAALEADLGPVDLMDKGDLQVYPVDCEPGSAGELLEVIFDNAYYDEDNEETVAKADALKAQADALDAKAPEQGGVAWLVEYVWNNGGGDDNPFSQGFAIHPDDEQKATEFSSLLEEFLDENDIAYDIDIAPEAGKHPLMTPQAAIKATAKVLRKRNIATPRLDAIAQSFVLDKKTPRPTATRRRASL